MNERESTMLAVPAVETIHLDFVFSYTATSSISLRKEAGKNDLKHTGCFQSASLPCRLHIELPYYK